MSSENEKHSAPSWMSTLRNPEQKADPSFAGLAASAALYYANSERKKAWNEYEASGKEAKAQQERQYMQSEQVQASGKADWNLDPRDNA